MLNATRVVNSMLLTGFGFFCYAGYTVGNNLDTKFLTENNCKYNVFSSKFMRNTSKKSTSNNDDDDNDKDSGW